MTSVDLKLAALSVAVEARQQGDPMHVVYEQGQAIYEWLMEDVSFKNTVGPSEVIPFKQ